MCATRGWEHATPQDTRHRREPFATMPRKGTRIGSGGRSKYGAIRTEVDGISFASKREAARFRELRALIDAGKICGTLELQPVYPLVVAGVQIGKYIADFRYYRVDGELVVEDVKGMPTPVYRLKRRIVEALYGIQITEVR